MHSRFRNGVYFLGVLMTGSLVLGYVVSEKIPADDHLEILSEYQMAMQCLKDSGNQSQKASYPRPFNPNFLSEYKAYILGIPVPALDRLKAFRKQNKWVNSASEFQQLTGISDSLLVQLQPFFKFPEWGNNRRQNPKKEAMIERRIVQKQDLNTAGAEDIQNKAKISKSLALRIVRYRERIGGFVHDKQLQDVYGLYPKQSNKILSLFTVRTPAAIVPIDVNEATVASLMAIPYFDFEMALAIHDYVKAHGAIDSFHELDQIEGFPMKKIESISLYLKI